jgi:hypothetical protein
MFSYYPDLAAEIIGKPTHCERAKESAEMAPTVASNHRWSISPWNRLWGRVCQYPGRQLPTAVDDSSQDCRPSMSSRSSPVRRRIPSQAIPNSGPKRDGDGPCPTRSSPHRRAADHPGHRPATASSPGRRRDAQDSDGEFVYSRNLLDPTGGTRVRTLPRRPASAQSSALRMQCHRIAPVATESPRFLAMPAAGLRARPIAATLCHQRVARFEHGLLTRPAAGRLRGAVGAPGARGARRRLPGGHPAHPHLRDMRPWGPAAAGRRK